MDNKSTTKRMIGAVVLVMIAALLLAWLLKGKDKTLTQQTLLSSNELKTNEILGFPSYDTDGNGSAPLTIGNLGEKASDAAQSVTDTASNTAKDAAKAVNIAGSSAMSGTLDKFQIRDKSNGSSTPTATTALGSLGTGSINGSSDTITPNTEDSTSTASANTQISSASNKSKKPVVSLVDEENLPKPRIAKAAKRTKVAPIKRVAKTTIVAPAAAVTSSASTEAGFVIQVLATAHRSKAESVSQSIAIDGYPAYVTEARLQGKSIYRVRIGSYPQRDSASAVQDRLKRRYTQNQLVQDSYITKN